MTLDNIINRSVLSSEIKVRMKIAIFMVLLFQFTNEIQPTNQSALLFYAFYALLEISSMVVVYRFSGNSAVGKDINEINLYALLIHIFRIPVYFFTELPMEIFKYSIWTLLILSILRLLYFKKSPNGDYQGIKLFFILESIRNKFTSKKGSFNYWSELLFFGSAIPLWFIIYKTNDQSVTITVVGLMLFIYVISDAIKTQAVLLKAADNEAELHADEALLLQVFNNKSVAEKAYILKLVAADYGIEIAEEKAKKADVKAEMVDEESFETFELKSNFKILGIFTLILMILFPITIGHYQKSFFNSGYASGFNDAKSNAPPKKETDFDKVLKCVFEANHNWPQPKGKGCLDKQ
jgi:hypothetical protein